MGEPVASRLSDASSASQPMGQPRKLALITGASAGIGAEFAVQLAALGFDLVLVARDAARLNSTAAQLRSRFGVAVEVLPADLLDAEQLALVEERVAAPQHPIDYLVNNAGFGPAKDFDENRIADEVALLRILAEVPMRLTHAALGQMLPRRSGTVLTVASIAGLAPLGTYSAAKAWAVFFSRWANAYYRGSGVRMTAVAPGFVRTEFHERAGITRESMAPSWAWLSVEKVVSTAIRDAARGVAVSVPSARYRLLALLLPAASGAVRRGVSRRGNKRRDVR